VKNVILFVCIALLSGCASIVNGNNQSVSVETKPATGASCVLSNDKGRWFINSTPGSVIVHRSFQDLVVDCHKKGYQVGLLQVPSKTKGMAFGNILFGGVIGAGVDMADGAAYDYPVNIQVPLLKAIREHK
jgi:uncharacterized protein YceK